MAEQYTVEELGARLKQRNPQLFGQFSDIEVGQKLLDKKPEFKKFLKTETVQPKQEGVKGVAGTAVGVGKGAIHTLTGMSGLGERLLGSIGKTLLPKSAEKALGIENAPTLDVLGKLGVREKQAPVQSSAEQLVPEKLRTAQGTAEKIGFGLEQIGEFFIPGGAALKAGKAIEGARFLANAPKIAKGAAKILGTAGAESVLAGGQTAIQKGNLDKETLQAAKYGALFPVGGAILGKTLKGVGKVAGKIVAPALGKSTGIGEGAIREAFNNPNVVKFARQAGKNVDEAQSEVLNLAKTGLNKLKNLRATDYQAKLAQIKLNPAQLDDVTSATRSEVKNILERYDIKIVPQTDKMGKKLNVLDFGSSTLTEGTGTVERAINDVMSWTDNTPLGLDKLKKRLGDYLDQTPYGTPAKKILTDLTSNLRSSLEKNVSGYKEMTQGYHSASDLIHEIESALSLGNKKAKETAMAKIMGSFKTGKESRQDMLKMLGGVTGEDILGKVAGVQASEIMPRGLTGSFMGGAGTIYSLLNPSAIPQLLLLAVSTSPRAVTELTSILGKVSRFGKKNAGQFSPDIQRALREWIIKYVQQPQPRFQSNQ